MSRTCIWLHDAALSPDDVSLRSHPDGAVIFVFHQPALQEEPQAFHRLAFVFDGVVELFQSLPQSVKEVHVGDPVTEIVQFCERHALTEIVWTDHPDPMIREIGTALERYRPVRIYPREQLAEYHEEPRRFSRYWDKVAKQVLGYVPRSRRKLHG